MKKILILLLYIPLLTFSQNKNINKDISSLFKKKFTIDNSFIQITIDYWDKKLYSKNFTAANKQFPQDIKFKLGQIKKISDELFLNENTLVYLKNDLSAILVIEKSKLPFKMQEKYEKTLCSKYKNMAESFNQILSYNCGIREINGFKFFINELKSIENKGLNLQLYKWSNQYWTESNNFNYHITINSDMGLKFNDIIKDNRKKRF